LKIFLIKVSIYNRSRRTFETILFINLQETSKSPDGLLKIGVKRKFEIIKRTGGNEGRETRMLNKSERAQHKPFSCDLCTLAFTRASHLARHRRVHTGERPFACSICPRMFARQDKLKQHLDSHLQWPKKKGGQTVSSSPTKGKRGRPRKVAAEKFENLKLQPVT